MIGTRIHLRFCIRVRKCFITIELLPWQEDGADIELYWSVMENQGIESHCKDLMLFNQFLWRKARELEENDPANVRRIDQVYEMIKGISKIFEVRAGHSSIESDSIYFKTDEATFWKGCL